MKVEKTQPRNFVDSCKLPDGRSVRVLGEGRLINLAAMSGNDPF
jgi:S-adenosylhomocysteine hydrolase